MENNEKAFSYTYSAEQQNEIESIRKKYMPREMDKMEQLRTLDRSVTKKGTVASLILGIIGTLIMGVGMCCTMVWMGEWFIPGIVIGVVGICILSLAYPVYTKITKRERERIAPQILSLTEELKK